MSAFYKGIPYWDRTLKSFGQLSQPLVGMERFMGEARNIGAIRPLYLPGGHAMLFDGTRKFSTLIPEINDSPITTIDLPGEQSMYDMGNFVLSTMNVSPSGDLIKDPNGDTFPMGRVVSNATEYDIKPSEAEVGMSTTGVGGGTPRDYMTSIGFKAIKPPPGHWELNDIVGRIDRGIVYANNLQFLDSFNHQHLGVELAAVREGKQIVNHPDELIQPTYDHEAGSDVGMTELMRRAELKGYTDLEKYMDDNAIDDFDEVYVPPQVRQIFIPMGHRNPWVRN